MKDKIIIRVIKRYIGNNKYNYIVNLTDLKEYELSDVFTLDLTPESEIGLFLFEKGIGEYTDTYHPIHFDPVTGKQIIFKIEKEIDISKEYNNAIKTRTELFLKGNDLTKEDRKCILNLVDIIRDINCVDKDVFQKMLEGVI